MQRLILYLMLLFPLSLLAQGDAVSPVLAPTVKVGKTLVDGDSIQYMELSNVYVYPQPTF
jgi:hypothetical protein